VCTGALLLLSALSEEGIPVWRVMTVSIILVTVLHIYICIYIYIYRITAKNKHNKNMSIKKEFQYRGNSGGDSNSDTEKEDHTEGTTYVHKGADINKEDGKKPVSDNKNSDDRREQTMINRRSAPFGKGSSRTTTKSNTSSTTSTSGRQLAPA